MDGVPLQQAGPMIGKYRRNRRLQACEPCRQSKLSCDHKAPCGRCVRRLRVSSCYYHPNPLTKNSKPAKENTPSEQSAVHGLPLRVPELCENFAASPKSTGRDVDTRAGHLGITSYSSIITESLDKLGLPSTDPKLDINMNTNASNDQISRGTRILSLLGRRTLIEKLMKRHHESFEGPCTMARPLIMNEWLSLLWRFHGETLKTQETQQIQELCHLLHRNSQTPMKIDGTTTALQWTRMGTGMNIRWEIIGMIFANIAIFAINSKDDELVFKEHDIEAATLCTQMFEGANLCLELCREDGVVNDVFVGLLHEVAIIYELNSKTVGNYTQYRLLGELSTAAIVLGLHQAMKADRQTPFFLVELRKRLRAMIYASEIGQAVFLGRPPRLSYRHWNLEPPLDLTDSQLLVETQYERAVVIANLDPEGYNQDGEIRHSTWLRFMLPVMKLKEDIMDLALGDIDREEILRQAELIQRKMDAHMANTPEFMLTQKPDKSQGEMSYDHLMRNAIRYARHSNKCILQRVLIRKAGINSTELVLAARQTLQMFMATSDDKALTGLLALHGVRSAVILAVELLKQEQLPIYPKDPILPRSQTIQDLSVFIAKLSDITPFAGAADLCAQGRRVISQILDKILSPPCNASRHANTNVCVEETDDLVVEMAQIAPAPDSPWAMEDLTFDLDPAHFGSDREFAQWLENMDWEQPIL